MEPISILGYSLGSIFVTYGGCLYYKYRKEIERHKISSEAYYNMQYAYGMTSLRPQYGTLK